MKKCIFSFLLGIFITASFGVFASIIYYAKEISFSPKDSSWNVTNVEDAINDLKNNYIPKSDVLDKIWNFDYTGSYQTFTAQYSGIYKIELWGASGSTSNLATPGYGGYTSGEIFLSQGAILYVYVGESGNLTTSNYNTMSFNGGGYTHSTSTNYGRGGGATDVRLVSGTWSDFDSLKSRIMVAGGGGSGGKSNDTSINYSTGGAAGGLYSYKGNGSSTTGAIATQTSGYAFGIGGPGLSSEAYSGSGGGYYGGSSSKTSPCDVTAGGSSYISGHDGCNAISELSTSSNIVHTGQSIHYSGYEFNNTVMIDGNGYNWTDVVGTEVIGMPRHDGTGTMVGNIGNGYAKITLVSLD